MSRNFTPFHIIKLFEGMLLVKLCQTILALEIFNDVKLRNVFLIKLLEVHVVGIPNLGFSLDVTSEALISFISTISCIKLESDSSFATEWIMQFLAELGSTENADVCYEYN
jgi:hypothetical protein